MLYKVGPRALHYPTRLWLIILSVLFATEYALMVALPVILDSEPSPLMGATVDALAVTAILAPVIWWTLVRPLREVIRLRTKFLGDLFMAMEAERRQVAHELHDGIGQHLSLLISGLRTAHESFSNPADAARCHDLEKLAQSALVEVKRIARGLRPSLLDDLGLVAAIEKVVRDASEHTTIEIALRAAALEGIRLPEPVETAVFRIVQESLANVLRHSGAAHATIELALQAGQIRLNIADDGRGFDVQMASARETNGGHLGLIGMRERVALLGGRFTLDAAPGRGCRISVTIPTARTAHE